MHFSIFLFFSSSISNKYFKIFFFFFLEEFNDGTRSNDIIKKSIRCYINVKKSVEGIGSSCEKFVTA